MTLPARIALTGIAYGAAVVVFVPMWCWGALKNLKDRLT